MNPPYLSLSWSVHCNFVLDGKQSKRVWACTPHPHQPGLIFHLVRQKSAIATLCVLCGIIETLVYMLGARTPRIKGLNLLHCLIYGCIRREIITVREQSYFSRLPKYWPPIPLSPWRVCTPLLCCGGGHTRRAERGGGGSIFWKTREIGLPSYSNNLSMVVYHRKKKKKKIGEI
jgi:hypothetical protein